MPKLADRPIRRGGPCQALDTAGQRARYREAAQLLRQGWTRSEVCLWFGIVPLTLSRWLARYRAGVAAGTLTNWLTLLRCGRTAGGLPRRVACRPILNDR
jgi:hypothetical protein